LLRTKFVISIIFCNAIYIFYFTLCND
jgi:hypothetical protein